MKVTDTRIPEVKIIEPKVFEDERGFFFESYNQQRFEEVIGYSVKFVQDNHSKSSRGVLRGLHYQLPPRAQAKLLRVVCGEIFDVAVDIRRKSSTFGQWVGVLLSENNRRQIWIPEGFAHGFLVLSKEAEIVYKTTDYYNTELERCLLWSDYKIAIDWPIKNQPLISVKDSKGNRLKNIECFE